MLQRYKLQGRSSEVSARQVFIVLKLFAGYLIAGLFRKFILPRERGSGYQPIHVVLRCQV